MKSLIKPCRQLLFVSFMLMAVSASHGQTVAPPDPEAARIQAIAEEAYIFGLPIVIDYRVMYSYAIDTGNREYKAPFNQIKTVNTLLTPADVAIPYPNNDTLFAMGWLDVRAEPVVISLPEVEPGRYYSLMLVDGTGLNYGILGTRSSGREAGDYLIVGPDWQGETPEGISRMLRLPTQFGLALTRVQVVGEEDVARVNAIQAQVRIRTLSAYTGSAPPLAAAAIDFPPIDDELARKNFFAYLDFALQFQPARPEDQDIRARLASIGIGNGNFDEFRAIAAKYPGELMAGVQAGNQKIDQAVASASPPVDGWSWTQSALDIDSASYGGNALKRAALARFGPYGLNAHEARYVLTTALANGERIDASSHNYTLTFAADQLPPVDAFWSVTAYDCETRSFMPNPLKRYLINSPMLPRLKRNADQSLTLHLRKDSPGIGWENNWLPVSGPVCLMLRTYGPREPILRGEWKVPPVVRADG
jgi:hypothetical protein